MTTELDQLKKNVAEAVARSDAAIKPCPCGATPKSITVQEGNSSKWAFASGSCCDGWFVEFRTQYHDVDSDECRALAVEAWNSESRSNTDIETMQELMARLEALEAECAKKPLLGTLLRGPRKVSSSGVDEWFDFPRYRVVAVHMDGGTLFVETLNQPGHVVGVEKLPMDSNQWELWGGE